MAKCVLVLSPHADDAEIGCGGFIAKTIADGGFVCVALATVGTIDFRHLGKVTDTQRVTEFQKAMASLGVQNIQILSHDLDGRMYTSPQSSFVTKLDDLIDDLKPDTVLIPLPSSHQDHRYCWEVGIAATRPNVAKHQPNMIAAYEYPASGWGDGSGADSGKGGIYVDISHHWEAKVKALECYETQMRGERHLFSINGIDALAKLRGLESGCERAELFHALRIRM